jgi:Peptidase family M23
VVFSATEAGAASNFQLPFPCGQAWSGQTRTDHSPANSVDLNRANDDGDPVVAAAAGTVTRVENTGDTSYGRWIEIDHGGGYTTRYAHLSKQDTRGGEKVSQGAYIGNVGTTGGSTGPHLHFEERLNGADIKIVLNGTQITYWGTATYTSKNFCGSGVSGTVRSESGVAVNLMETGDRDIVVRRRIAGRTDRFSLPPRPRPRSVHSPPGCPQWGRTG